MKIGIGIDTGGTYTDAVAYDFSKNTILGSAKALTTKEDLSIGILEALDGIPHHLLKDAEIISLSTTLATNACVENRGGNAKLIFFGGDRKVIDENGGKYGLPTAKDIYIQESFTKFSGNIEREPDWELFENEIENDYGQFDGVGIIEINAMRNGAVVEKKAKAIFREKYDIPVVCGYELFSQLNCLQRGSSTLLNARLFPVIKDFLAAIKKSVVQRGIDATLIIVRSDGSMMSEKFASIRPVETLLCGPAASAIGGLRLSNEPNSIIIDMGGTTTDIAVVKDGIPITVVDGVSIGKWKTFVDGLYVKTFGLGGDSAIHYHNQHIYLEEYRVVPLCVVAEEHPIIIDNLKQLWGNRRKHTLFLHEHYILIRDISENPRYTDVEKTFCNALKNGPLTLWDAAAAIDRDMYTLDVKKLIKEGIVQICGLTPTDIMHIKKDFSKYATEASLLAAEFVAFNLDVTVEALCDLVYTEVKRKLYLNIVKIMLENHYPHYMKHDLGNDVERFINDSFRQATNGEENPYIHMNFKTDFTLVGIGAPIRIFLEDVARMLHTTAVIPDNYEVANALGAITGNISASHSIEIRPLNSPEGTVGFIVYGNSERKIFPEKKSAVAFAVSEAKDGARKEAINRGAKGNIIVTCNSDDEEAEAKDFTVYLGTTITAHAVGALGF